MICCRDRAAESFFPRSAGQVCNESALKVHNRLLSSLILYSCACVAWQSLDTSKLTSQAYRQPVPPSPLGCLLKS